MLELIKGLKEKNDQFDINLVILSNKIDYQYVFDLPIKVQIIPKKDKDPSLVLKLRKIIKEFNPDVIHSWDIMSSVYLIVAKMFLNKTFVNGVIYNSAQNSDVFERHYYRVKLTSAFSDITVANSNAGLKAYKASPKRSICIYNGIDLKRFDNLKSPADVELDILKQPKGDRFIATMVAAFEARKDYDTLIEAAIKLCSTNKKMVFLLIGDGKNKQRIFEKVPAEMLNNQIYFLGLRDDIESILQITDIGVLISNRCEGLSNSVIEYMASGLPVIATEGGGTDELVRDGFNGFLIENKKSEMIIEKIETLMQNPGLAATLGANAKQWVRDNLDAQKMTGAYIDLYTKLVNKKRGSLAEIPAMANS